MKLKIEIDIDDKAFFFVNSLAAALAKVADQACEVEGVRQKPTPITAEDDRMVGFWVIEP